MIRRLRPVGSPVPLVANARSANRAEKLFGRGAVRLGSGTAALARAVEIVRAANTDAQRDRVLIPAYTCPDVVAAIRAAGAWPVLIDTPTDGPFPAPEAYEDEIDERTLCLVSVAFLGVRSHTRSLVEIAHRHGLPLIEDAAQWIPREGDVLPADLTTWSFGRGKPISLLGGGLLAGPLLEGLEASQAHLPLTRTGLKQPLMAMVYDLMIGPLCYGALARLPFMGLGETRYHALEAVTAMGPWYARRIDAAVNEYEGDAAAHRQRIRQLLSVIRATSPALKVLGVEQHPRYLRMPIVCPTLEARDALLSAMLRHGVEASCMYARALSDIDGVTDHLAEPRDVPGARSFADRLIALPIHCDVTPRWISRMHSALQSVEF